MAGRIGSVLAQRPTAIVVEPDPADAQTLVGLLAHQGFSVRTASEPEEAMRLCQEAPSDLLVLSLTLSDRALEAVQPLTRLCPAMHLVALSEYAAGSVRLAPTGPPIPVVRKPVDEQKLLAALGPARDRSIRARANRRPASLPRLYLIK